MDLEFIEISTKCGKLRGLVKKSAGRKTNRTYYSFQGIPYAKPPIGELRFKVAEPYGQWETVLDATKEGNDSIQTHELTKEVTGDEDCLYLNVYTPQKPGEDGSQKAVMVYIHGGGFLKGSGSTVMYGPDFFVEEDIVLVTINYRLGVFGFLSLENDSVSGNMGLKDQVLALHWVQQNISSFGGDPNNVTIFGESAGAASVHYLMLSPLSRGLFHKAILQSGTAFCECGFQNKPREKALLLASILGCTSQDDETVLKFLKSVSAVEIIDVQDSKLPTTEKEKIHKIGTSFLPCVEVAVKSPFLPDYPRKIMARGEFSRVPVIMGLTDKEGLFAVASKMINSDCERVNSKISVMVPHDLNIPAGSEEEKALGREILKFYTNRDTMSMDIDAVKGYVDYITDVLFVYPNANTRYWFLKHMKYPVYSYLFSYISLWNLASNRVKTAYPDLGEQLFNFGAGHSDELTYFFKTNQPLAKVGPSSDDEALMEKLVKAWSNFAKTGDPNCKELGIIWQPDNIESPNFVDIGKIWKVSKGTFFPKREQFWKNIYDMYSYNY